MKKQMETLDLHTPPSKTLKHSTTRFLRGPVPAVVVARRGLVPLRVRVVALRAAKGGGRCI